jgi:acetyl-CoA synthetase
VFVTLKPGHTPNAELAERQRSASTSRKEIGKFANRPDQIRFTDALPKTRSGKIMRRLLQGRGRGRGVHRRHLDARRT